MKVAALQMVSTPRVEENLTQAKTLIAQAAAEGAELVALPEYFCLMGQHDSDKLAIAEPLADPGDAQHVPDASKAPIQAMLSEAARQHGVWLIGGTLPLQSGQAGRVFNSTLVYDPKGHRVARYDKIHLFCFDDGERAYDEAKTLAPGSQLVAFDMTDRSGQAWRIGLSVCYDLRFPELFRSLGQDQALDLIVVPAAFTYTTGQAHWELLLRARAVENLCHVLAIGQGGEHENGRRTFGHSMVIGPWGQVMASRPEGPGVVIAELDHAQQQRYRAQLPALAHRVIR